MTTARRSSLDIALTLKVEASIAAGSTGSVVFVIKGDSKEAWRSPKTKTGKLHDYTVDLSGTEKLELIVEAADDGTSSDWGLRLEPTLQKQIRL